MKKSKAISFLLTLSILASMIIPGTLALPATTVYAEDGSSNNGLVTSKTVVKNKDGSYTLRLEAYATGSTYTTVSSKPTDIVLVLDISGSMSDYISVANKETVANLDPKYAEYYKWRVNFGLGDKWCDMRYHEGEWQYRISFNHWIDCDKSLLGNSAEIKKINALKIAVDGFLDSTAQNSGDNRVALVTYASGASTKNELTSNFDTIKNSVWKLNANGATYADAGMANAKDVLDKIPADRDSNKVVIMFTDGEPNHGSGFDEEVANTTISTSKQMKDNGVTVYTVGVMKDANNADTTSDFNRYMNYVSSNYPDATSMNNGGEKYEHPDGGNYYLTADNLETLKEIFKNISNEVGGATNSKLDSATVMKDIISDSFQLPVGASANSIRVYTADCTAINDDIPTFGTDNPSDLTASIAEDGRTITVTGFDYSANYVGKNTTTGDLHTPGKKLIVEIPIVVRTGFLGGNNVPTNGDTSGVYDKDGNSVEKFVVPTVNVPIKDVTVTAQDKNVYLLGDLAADHLKAGATVNVGGVPLNLTAENFGLETWQNEYVNITVEIKNKAGEVITALNDLTEDTTYTISVTVSPKTNGEGADGTVATAQSGKNTPAAKINVFKPELTFKDSIAYYGEAVPTNNDYSSNRVGEKWLHDGTEAVPDKMLGTKPTLGITYTPDESKLGGGKYTKQDVPVSATVNIGTENVNAHTTFVHQDCAGKTCTLPENYHFWIHIQTCTLEIKKFGGNADEPYVFTVLKDGKEYSEVTVMGNGSETIYELPIGTYTVKEDTGWSWRYTPSDVSPVTLEADNPTGTITCTNSIENNKWLNGFSDVEKNIFGVSHNNHNN